MSGRQQMYIHGNVVTKPAYEPERRKRKVSSQVKRNRRKALYMSSGYVMFLAAAAVLALAVCVNYVMLQSRITTSSQEITSLREDLADLREENNTRYNSIMDSVNLDEVRERAQGSLGMSYAAEDQIVEYESPSADYVKQYEDIPEDGVLAESDRHVD